MSNQGWSDKGASAADLYAALDADTSTLQTSYERAAKFRLIAEQYEAEGSQDTAKATYWQAALFDFMALPRGERRKGSEARFFPQWEDYIIGRVYPAMEVFGDEAIEAIETLLGTATNPIHKARCADFLWEKRGNYRAATSAIEAYLEIADLYLANRWYAELADALDRASELALRLGDKAHIARAKDAGFRIADELVHDESHPVLVYTSDILKTLQRFDRRLNDQERAEIVALIEECIAIFDHDGTGKRGFLSLLATPEARRRIAESLEAEARVAMSERGAIVGFAIYREALDAWVEAGDAAKVDELKRIVGEAAEATGSEMRSISVTGMIPREEFERRANYLVTLPLEEALLTLAGGAWPVPKVDQVREQAAENRRRFPLQWLVTRVTLKDTRVVDAPSNDDEIEGASFAQQYTLDQGLRRMELSLILDRLETEKGLDTTALVDLLRRGGIVDENTLETVSIGFDRYFAKDYVSALHILVPQMEDILRSFLIPLAVATTSTREGLTREKPLEEVLRTPKLREVLSEDLAVFLEMLFTDRRGANMRNETAHGLIKAKDCTRDRLHYVIFCYITVAKFVVSQHASSEDEPLAQTGA